MTAPDRLAQTLNNTLAKRRRPHMTLPDAFMQGAGFDAKLSSTIEREMWEKWVLLAALGGVTCLMRGSIGETIRDLAPKHVARIMFAGATPLACSACISNLCSVYVLGFERL